MEIDDFKLTDKERIRNRANQIITEATIQWATRDFSVSTGQVHAVIRALLEDYKISPR